MEKYQKLEENCSSDISKRKMVLELDPRALNEIFPVKIIGDKRI